MADLRSLVYDTSGTALRAAPRQATVLRLTNK